MKPGCVVEFECRSVLLYDVKNHLLVTWNIKPINRTLVE